MKLGMIFILVYMSAILAACNKGSASALEISPEKQGVDVPAFQGNWTSDKCAYWGGGGDYHYSAKQYFSIKGSLIESYSKDYNSKDCSGDFRSIMTFKMKFDLSKEVSPGRYNIDVIPTEIVQTVFDQDSANSFNTSAYCGYTDWVVGVEKVISDRDCMLGAKVNQLIYSIVKVDDTQIQLGEHDETNDGTTPERRHKTLGPAFKKQN